MGNEKKDLTRIEDLGEFFHEINTSEFETELPTLPTGEEAFPEELPDLPTEGDLQDSLSELPTLPPDQDELFKLDTDTTFSLNEPFQTGEGFTQSDALDDTATSEFSQSEEDSVEASPWEARESQDIDFIPDASAEFHATDTEPLETPSIATDTEVRPELTSDTDLVEPSSPEANTFESFAKKEDFQEMREFAERATVLESSSECNPAFSLVAKNIKFLEDSQEILGLLKELGFKEDMMQLFQKQLDRGSLLIPRISEFSAAYVAQRLRRFNLELSVSQSDLLHPQKEPPIEKQKGLVSRKSFGQNQTHRFDFKAESLEAQDIQLSTLPHLEGHNIARYLGVASEHSLLSADDVESQTTEAIHKCYSELAQKLKGHALEKEANAIVGIHYQLTPLPAEPGELSTHRYRLSCTGNLVWAQKDGI